MVGRAFSDESCVLGLCAVGWGVLRALRSEGLMEIFVLWFEGLGTAGEVRA